MHFFGNFGLPKAHQIGDCTCAVHYIGALDYTTSVKRNNGDRHRELLKRCVLGSRSSSGVAPEISSWTDRLLNILR